MMKVVRNEVKVKVDDRPQRNYWFEAYIFD